MSELIVGESAPDFTLYSDTKEKVSLTDFRGKNMVLAFFPLAFTGTCTTELCTFRDDIEQYNRLNAVILAISVDSLHTLARYKADQQLNFTLLSDFNKEVSTLYKSIYDTFSFGMKGVSKRATFIIDKKGDIQLVEILENAGELPNFALIKQKLQELN
jgi:glutaredoxin-dependent peroxiredoxin